MSDFFAPYRKLGPVEQLAATAFGVVFPHALTRQGMAKTLAWAKFQRGRRPIGFAAFRNAFDAAVKAGILQEIGTHGNLVAAGRWSPWLTLEAHRRRRLAKIKRAFRRTVPHYWDDDDADFVMELRCHAVASRFDLISSELDEVESDDWRWLARPGVAHVLTKLPEKYVDAAFRGCLDEVARTAEPPEAVLAAYAKSRADRGAHAAGVAFIHVLRGAFDDAIEVFSALPEDLRNGKPARTGLASTRAFIATLRGDDAEAVRFIDEAIASEKAGTRKRNVFPACPAFALSLLSLVRDHTPSHNDKLTHLLKVAEKVEADYTGVMLVDLAEHIRGGGTLAWTADPGSGSVSNLFEALAGCWAKDFSQSAGGAHFATLLNFGARAIGNGYRWLGTECLDVCARWWRADGQAEDDLWKMFDGRPFEAEAPAEIAAGSHRRLGTQTLATLVKPVPVWELVLQDIEQVAYDTRKKPKRKKAPAVAQRRMAWVVGEDSYGTLSATPKEQRGYKNGTWSKGRVVALKRLQTQAAAMDFLLDQDRAAAAQIGERIHRWQNHSIHYLPASGFFALAGHPYVFNDDGDPVEVVRRDPELLLEERDGRLLVKVDPHIDTAGPGGYRVFLDGGRRLEVTRFTAGHKKLCDAIQASGIDLPLEARERLVGAVSTLADEIRVQGVVGGAAQVAAQIEADPQPWVRLEPSGPGLVAAVLVEPVPDSGVHYQPGVGGTTVFATIDGQAVQARRDLDAETTAARELAAACPMLSGVGPDSSLTLVDPGDCLELVDQLGAANARCLWPKGEPFKVVARADTSSLQLTVKSAADWFSASGELDIDAERALDLRALFELIDQNPSSRFVPLGEGAFVSLTAEFRRQLADLRSVSTPSGKKQVRIHGLAALAMLDFFDAAKLEADERWDDRLQRFREAGSFEPHIPGTLQAELRPYQEDGFRWLAKLSRWGAGACLADDMGLGKTVQTLALLLDRARSGPALVVAPTSVVANWLDEARRFAPTLNVTPYTGTAASRAGKLDGLGAFDLVVTTYGLLHNDIEDLGAVAWDTVVLDEAQAIKNPATKRARAARKLTAAFRMVTTGTPIQNNVVDLFSLFAFLNPGMLGSQKRFRENFALPIESERDPAARTRLRRLISPFVLRRVKADVLDDLPPRTEVTLHVEMSPEEAALYEALRQRAVDDLEALAHEGAAAFGGGEDGQRRLQVLAHLTRLRLACCNPRLVQPDGPPSSKLATFATTLDELRQGRHKVLVFSQFVRHLKLIEEHLTKSGVSYQYLDGSTPPKARAERIAAFQAGEGDAFLISLKAGGVGLNLTAADYVIHMDPWWNPAAEDQASDRAHRIGQTRPVTIYRLVAKGTIEEQIVELHRHKRELADRLLEGAAAPARLSTEQLLGLLRGDG